MTDAIFSLRPPAWVETRAAACTPLDGLEARMAFVIATARLNIETGGGGPFAAAVFERDTGRLVALGVNLVERARSSILHAETVALALAQTTLGEYDLSAAHLPAHELVSSAEPCAMCLGAVPWSGVKRLVAGARREDVEAVGFDEGDKPGDWPAGLAARGIEVVRDVGRHEAARVIAEYAGLGRAIYNPRGATRRD